MRKSAPCRWEAKVINTITAPITATAMPKPVRRNFTLEIISQPDG